MLKAPGVFVLLTVLLWGAAGLLDKLVLRWLGPNETFVVRMGVNALLSLAVFAWGVLPARAAVAQAGKLPVLVISASLTLTLAAVFCYIKALASAEASRVVPLTSAFPLVTVLLAVLFLGEALTPAKLLGTLLICAGVGLLSL
ncbi:MAG: EamA family transporter [Elusimicrobia bacterium]|nr:EamA family transporter [Elusimicrobiota bacterium]